jgi:hypothetical protein
MVIVECSGVWLKEPDAMSSSDGASWNDTSVSSTNKTDRIDITEILLKVVLNTITIITVLIWYC